MRAVEMSNEKTRKNSSSLIAPRVIIYFSSSPHLASPFCSMARAMSIVTW